MAITRRTKLNEKPIGAKRVKSGSRQTASNTPKSTIRWSKVQSINGLIDHLTEILPRGGKGLLLIRQILRIVHGDPVQFEHGSDIQLVRLIDDYARQNDCAVARILLRQIEIDADPPAALVDLLLDNPSTPDESEDNSDDSDNSHESKLDQRALSQWSATVVDTSSRLYKVLSAIAQSDPKGKRTRKL